MRQFAVIVLTAGLLGCHGSNSLATVGSVRIAIHADPVPFLPFRIAQDFGYFQQEGLAVTMSEVPGGSKAMQALLGGSVDVAVASVSDAIQLAAEGRDVRCFLLLYTRPTIALAVALAMSGRSGHPGLAGVRGCLAPGSASHQVLNFLLASNGLLPRTTSVSVGMAGTSLAALSLERWTRPFCFRARSRRSRVAIPASFSSRTLVRPTALGGFSVLRCFRT